MIFLDRNTKDLVIPKSLGNFATGGGTGSGVTPEEAAEIASAVTEAAIADYDTEIQVDLEDIRENLSATTEDLAALSAYTATISGRSYDTEIEALSGATSANTEDIAALDSDLQALSAYTATISGRSYDAEIEALSAATKSVEDSLANYATTADTQAISQSLADYATTASTAALSASTVAISGNVTANTADIATLSAATSGVASDIVALSGVTSGLSGQIGELSTNITALSGDTSALTASISALMANDNIAFFNLIKDYGNTSEELARLYDDMDAANTAGKTVVALSNFATGDTFNASVFATFRKDDNGGFYGAGSGVHYNGTTYIAARALPIFRRDDYYNVIKKDGHFYFKDMGTIEPYTLPTAAANTKGGVKVGSGLTVNSETMSVKIGDGLAFSGDTLIVSGISGGGNVFVIYDVWAQNTQLADFLFQYANNGSISSGFPEDTRILLWLGQDFQGAFDPHSQGFVELYPSEFKDVEGTDVFFLGGVYATSDTDAYAVRVGYTAQGYSSNNWVERIRQDIAVYKPAFVRFGNDERGYLIYDADNDRFEYNNGYVATGDTSTVCPDLIDKMFTNFIFDGGDIWTGSEYLYPLNTNKFYVTQNGETTTYAAPRIKRKQLASTVTIDGVNFDWEITYDYGDWILTAYYAGNDGNDAANLRITSA